MIENPDPTSYVSGKQQDLSSDVKQLVFGKTPAAGHNYVEHRGDIDNSNVHNTNVLKDIIRKYPSTNSQFYLFLNDVLCSCANCHNTELQKTQLEEALKLIQELVERQDLLSPSMEAFLSRGTNVNDTISELMASFIGYLDAGGDMSASQLTHTDDTTFSECKPSPEPSASPAAQAPLATHTSKILASWITSQIMQCLANQSSMVAPRCISTITSNTCDGEATIGVLCGAKQLIYDIKVTVSVVFSITKKTNDSAHGIGSVEIHLRATEPPVVTAGVSELDGRAISVAGLCPNAKSIIAPALIAVEACVLNIINEVIKATVLDIVK